MQRTVTEVIVFLITLFSLSRPTNISIWSWVIRSTILRLSRISSTIICATFRPMSPWKQNIFSITHHKLCIQMYPNSRLILLSQICGRKHLLWVFMVLRRHVCAYWSFFVKRNIFFHLIKLGTKEYMIMLMREQCRLVIREYSLSQNMKHNKLSAYCVDANSVTMFKKYTTVYLRRQYTHTYIRTGFSTRATRSFGDKFVKIG